MKPKSKKIKIITLIAIALIAFVGILIGKVYSDNDNHFVVDVIKEQAQVSDDNVKLTETIVKEAGAQYFDSEELDYQVKIQNNYKNNYNGNVYNKLAIVVDSSYSMQENGAFDIAKTTAKELAAAAIQKANIDSLHKTDVCVGTNSGIKVSLGTTNTTNIDNTVNGFTAGEAATCSNGLQQAVNAINYTAMNPYRNIGTIVFITDGTDNVVAKMQELKAASYSNLDELNFITVLIDFTSSAYMDLTTAQPVIGDVYVLPNSVNQEDIVPANANIYSKDDVVDTLNKAVKNIKLDNTFSELVSEYFEIKDVKAVNNVGTITLKTEGGKTVGYEWEIDKLNNAQSATLTFTLKLKKDANIDARYIFEEINTNKDQEITYDVFGSSDNTLKGADGTGQATTIKICKGYDLVIKAVNESDQKSKVEGVTLKVIGINEAGETVCDIQKQTNSRGEITITPKDARALRGEGEITYTVSAVNAEALAGYERTDSIVFGVNNDKISRTLVFNDNGSKFNDNPVNESTRTVTVEMPIATTKADFEVIAQDISNSNIVISGCEFKLIQPKLNNKNEMAALYATTDVNGKLHFYPTVMTKNGKYEYILEQVTAPDAYEKTGLTKIIVEFNNGRIVAHNTVTNEIKTQYNDDVTAELDPTSQTQATDHVIINVGNKNIAQNPFELEINLVDADDNTKKINGAIYEIQTVTTTSTRTETIATNTLGQIKTNIYGTGILKLVIREKTPKVGYKPEGDENKKEITINYSTGVPHIIIAEPTAIHNTSAYTTQFIKDSGGNEIGIQVNLTSQKKDEQNIVRINAIEADENDVSVGAGVLYDLIDENGVSYGPAATDDNGQISFAIGNWTSGSHSFTLVLDTTTFPSEYDLSQIDAIIPFDLEFDANGLMIRGTLDTGNYTSVHSADYKVESGDIQTNYTYDIKHKYKLDAANTYRFNVVLKDSTDKTTALEGAQYNVTIKYDIQRNGTTITKTKNIVRRQTNAFGKISTFIPKGDAIITVKEVKPTEGYALDNTEQEIHLEYNQATDTMNITAQGPYDLGATLTTDPERYNGAQKEGADIVYHHYTRPRSEEDTYLNLTVRKQDMNEAYVDGVILNVKSEDLLDSSGNNLDQIIVTGSQTRPNTNMEGEIVFDYDEYINALPDAYTIRVPGLKFVEGTSENQPNKYYNLTISEMEVTGVDTSGNPIYATKPGTEVKLRLIYSTQGHMVKLISIETTYGNRLVKDKHFSSSSDDIDGKQKEDALGVYLSNVEITLYTKYDDVGNASIDFMKKGIDGSSLIGAEYDVKILNPDTSVVRKHITIDNNQDNSGIELKGVTLNVGSYIYLTETKAPLGYALNENVETLLVTGINELGEITLEHVDNSYNPARLSINKGQATITAAETLKENYVIELTDYQLDIFKVEIDARDTETQNLIPGYEFKINTTLGAQKTVSSGNVTQIGGNQESTTVTYTIKPTQTARYYKKIQTDFYANVVFDASGNVDVLATMNAQTDPNYGTLWKIANISATAEGNLRIDVFVEHQDPLKVKLQTMDSITKQVVNTVNYKITPSEVINAEGSTDIDVGYILENGTMTYNLKQTSVQPDYELMPEFNFRVTYTNEIVTLAEIATVNTVDTNPEISITGAKEVTIKIYQEPKVPFKITNTEYFAPNGRLLDGRFEITELSSNETANGATNSDGEVTIYDATFGKDSSKMYRVKQTKAASGYATINDFYIKVDYDADRNITSAILVDEFGNPITYNRFVNISWDNNPSTSNILDDVKITVKNYPSFKINILDVDRRDGTTKIAGTEYSVTSTYIDEYNNTVNFTNADGIITNADGLGIADLDKTRDNTAVIYTVKEVSPATGYQTIGNEIQVRVEFDSDGFVMGAPTIIDSNLSNIAEATNVTGDAGRFEINLTLKNNPLLQIRLTSKDRADATVKLRDVGYQITGVYESNTITNSSSTNKVNTTGTPQTSYSNVDGLSISYMDRTLENKEIIYTIKAIKKAVGYKWIDEDIVIKVTYDANGEISTVAMQQGGNNANLIAWDKDNFTIDLDVLLDEIEEFGIHLTVEDTYDSDKKINDMEVEAWLCEGGNTSYVSDGTYELVGDNKLKTGADRDSDGLPDIAYGEDYLSMGEYITASVDGARQETRTLRLEIKNPATNANGYYKNSATGDNIGYYKGNQYFEDARYQNVKYKWLINVTFNEEGKIVGVQPLSGENQFIGWLVDNRYLEVTHSDYKLNVKMKLFPMLKLDLKAIDNYYKNEDGSDLDLSGNRFNISTTRHDLGPTHVDEYVTAGYIGHPHYIDQYTTVYGDIYEGTNTLYVPIENNYTRNFYVFEEVEPTNYQKYSDWYTQFYYQRLTAIISIVFDEKGEIDYEHSIERNLKDTAGEYTGVKVPIFMDQAGTGYLSSNNLKEYRYTHTEHPAKMTTTVGIGYALTTKIRVIATDEISRNDTLSGLYIYPYINNTYKTNLNYYYSLTNWGRFTTNSYGVTNFTYWGAAETDSLDQYIIGSSRVGNAYNGYFFPDDLAGYVQGGSGNAKDYYAHLDVTYDDNGRISNVQSLATDVWGDDNTAEITWNSETGQIEVKMLYDRKFQTRLNKQDYDDKTIKLDAKFDVVSNKDLRTSISTAESMKPLGKVYKDTTVKYTLSETDVPEGYFPITDEIDYFVTFDQNGNISASSVRSSSEFFGDVSTSTTTKQAHKTQPDLSLNIKNKAAFMLDLRVIDQFYKNDGLADVYLEITNSKGDKAYGNPQTDSRGYALVKASPVYKGEAVKYYIKQLNTASGYYANNTIVELEVKFNDNGKVEWYRINNGNQVVNNFNANKYLNTKKISLEIMNMPKDVKLGLYKYDRLTNTPMDSVDFNIKKVDMNSGATTETIGSLSTAMDGSAIFNIDTFATSINGKTIKYIISEANIPPSYRAIGDLEFLVKYAPDGHIEDYTQLLNNAGMLKAQASIDVASNGVIRYLNGQRVHMNLTVPNDNAFDLVIINEDENYSGLGIEGSKFKVTVNGTVYTPSATDSSGRTQVSDIATNGQLIISVAQTEAGEGYRTDLTNSSVIHLDKSSTVYKLDLNPSQVGFIDDKNAQDSKAVILVDEQYGKVYITFKNETKTELTLQKEDYSTLAGLEGAEFKITAQQVDPSTGDPIGDPETITTATTTDADGKMYFDLGVAPQSEKWIYTFEETEYPINKNVTPNRQYNEIDAQTVEVVFDQVGRMHIGAPTSNRVNAATQTSNINSRHMVVTIYNGEIPPAYTVKVYKKDSQTNNPITGAKISMNLTDAQTGEFIGVNPRTQGSISNGATSETGNLGIDYKMYPETQDKVAIIDKGLVYIDNVDFEGTLNIQVIEQQTAPGYVIGDNIIQGNVKIQADYLNATANSTQVQLAVVDNDGLNVAVNDTTREIVITMYNDPEVKFNITDIEYFTPNDPISGISYDITSVIHEVTGMVPTSLNVTTGITDSDGKVTAEADQPNIGKIVRYKLHQNLVPGYRPLNSDIEIEVRYGVDGKIIGTPTLLTNKDMVTIDGIINGREINLTVRNKTTLPDYKVQVEKHAVDVDSAANKYDRVVEGAVYKVIVHQHDNGPEYTTFTGTSDEFGMINIPDLMFTGTGRITVTIQEQVAPEGYSLNTDVKTLSFYRDPDTGNITETYEDDIEQYNYLNTDDENYTKGEPVRVILQPFDKQDAYRFTLFLDKYSTNTNELITKNHAKFDALLIQEDDEGNVLYEDHIGELETNDEGKIIQPNLALPKEEGDYQLHLTETEAPKGFVKSNDPIIINLHIENDETGFPVIKSASLKAEYANTHMCYGDQLIDLDIGNNIIPGYKVQVEKHVMDTDTDLNAYERLLPGATYRVTVLEEDEGTEPVQFVAISDENGLIDVPGLVFNGFGYVSVTIEELDAPDGYVVDNSKKLFRMYRHEETGNFTLVNSGVNVDGDQNNTGVNCTFIDTTSEEYIKWEPIRVILKPVDVQGIDKFTLVINKYSTSTDTLIKNNHATFDVNLVQEDEQGNKIYEDNIGRLETNNLGKVEKSNLTLPTEPGEYKLYIKEKDAPEGYVKRMVPIEVKLTIGKDTDGNPIIKDAIIISPDGTEHKDSIEQDLVSVKNGKQLISINVSNRPENEILGGEYSLDITKVDATTDEPIADMALFKVWLPDELNTAVYAETSQTSKGPGKLDYCYIERDKDYSVRLSHMNKPQGPGTVVYTFREILPPNGYQKINEDLKLTLTFDYGTDGELYITNAISSNPRYLRINTPLPAVTNQSFSVDILNYTDEEDDLYLKSTEYLIGTKPAGYTRGVLTEYKTGDRFISKVEPHTTLADFVSNLDTNGIPVVTTAGGAVVGLNDWVGTNNVLTVTKGDKKIVLTIVVKGDTSGDGHVSAQDYADTKKQWLEDDRILSEGAFMAIDFEDNGSIDPEDLSTEKQWLFEYM